MKLSQFTCLTIAWIGGLCQVGAFTPNRPIQKRQKRIMHVARTSPAPTIRKVAMRNMFTCSNRSILLFSSTSEESNEKDAGIKALDAKSPESTTKELTLPPRSRSNSNNQEEIASDDPSMLSSSLNPEDFAGASTTVMITREMKRVLIEELGYRRGDVDVMRVELAGPIVEKRISCPPQGMPDSWCDKALQMASTVQDDRDNSMRKRLEKESKYPLKFPFLGISLILLGKGLSDLIITLVKVYINFPGASLTEEFMGIPILVIDMVAIIVGTSFGAWTWNTMKD